MIFNSKKGLTFIGMPSSGKSVTGRLLAQKLNCNYVDLDILIREKKGKNHHLVLEEIGEDAFKELEEQYALELEEQYALELEFENLIFSPGGSMIFSPRAMEKIKQESFVIHLGVGEKEIERRLGDKLHKDGIIGLETKGLSKIILERNPLYQKYADLYIDTDGLTQEEVAEKVLKKIKIDVR